MNRFRLPLDRFTSLLIGTVALATLLPAQGMAMQVLKGATVAAIAALFFLHGAKLSRNAIVSGAGHWRLHLVVFASTFLLFPLLGLLLRPLLSPLVTPELYLGILFLCVLPSTVQSSIAFTSIARGNVPAAVCSASASSLLGIIITPLLAGLLLGSTASTGSGNALASMGRIMVELLLPFVAGQASRRWIGGWVDRNKGMLQFVDQGSILLVVYVAFSEAILQGLWHQVAPLSLAGVAMVDGILLALALFSTRVAARALGFNRADEVTAVFCGSKKSLANGVPMAGVLFSSHAVGMLVLPLMLFHQMQLMVCAVLAKRYARLAEEEPAAIKYSYNHHQRI